MQDGINYFSEELIITVKGRELYDEINNEFINVKDQKLRLKHSLISLSKWESKWKKPFLDEKNKTVEETIDYIRFMTITQNVDPNVYLLITSKHIALVNEYLNDKMSATTFHEQPSKPGESHKKNIVTAEIIYYWMAKFNIPSEYQKWHLAKLMSLIKVCSIKEAPPKKMSKSEIAKRNKALNASRRKKMNSKG